MSATRQRSPGHPAPFLHPLCSKSFKKHTWIAEIRLVASCLVTPVFLCVVDVLVDLRQASRGDVGGGLRCGHDAGD